MPTVGEFIQQRQEEIVVRWRAEVQSAASARGLTAPKLTNIMPEFLASLSEDGAQDSDDRRRVSVLGHLATRIRQGFDLSEVISEFHVLERSIVRMWGDLAEQDKPVHDDIERMRERVQDATFQVTDEFFHHMLEEEQSEKRYLRLLQDIASEALHDDRRLLPERLRDVLDVIAEAMSARGAAVKLFGQGTLWEPTVACTGDDALAAYMRPIADHESAESWLASVGGGEAHAVEVPGAVHPGGVGSLLAAPLPRQSELHGVLYVAIPYSREISPRDLHRLELLADRLGLHLENARLFGELRDTIATLHVERSMRERFVATLAHDLRGPLSAARMAAELIAREPARAQDLAIRVERNVERVDRMIRTCSMPTGSARASRCRFASRSAISARWRIRSRRRRGRCTATGSSWTAARRGDLERRRASPCAVEPRQQRGEIRCPEAADHDFGDGVGRGRTGLGAQPRRAAAGRRAAFPVRRILSIDQGAHRRNPWLGARARARSRLRRGARRACNGLERSDGDDVLDRATTRCDSVSARHGTSDGRYHSLTIRSVEQSDREQAVGRADGLRDHDLDDVNGMNRKPLGHLLSDRVLSVDDRAREHFHGGPDIVRAKSQPPRIGRIRGAHRLAWVRHHGPGPVALVVGRPTHGG